MKLRRSIVIDGPRGIVLESGGDEFSGRLRGTHIADPRLRVPLTAMRYQHPELEIVRAALDQDTAVEKRA
jgi:hypothetical protein